MSGFTLDQGAGVPAVAVLCSSGEPGKASPIRGGGRTAKRIRRCEPGKIVAVWSSLLQRAWAAWVRCGERRGQGDMQLAIGDTDIACSGEQLMQQSSPLLIDTGVVRAQ